VDVAQPNIFRIALSSGFPVMAKVATFVHPHETFQVSVMLFIQKCNQFGKDATLTDSPSIFRTEISQGDF
jgi:hypothetical protein